MCTDRETIGGRWLGIILVCGECQNYLRCHTHLLGSKYIQKPLYCRYLLHSPCVELTIHGRNLYMVLAQSLPSYHPIHGRVLFLNQSPCIEQIHCRDLLQSPSVELTIHGRNLYMVLAQSLPSYHPIHGRVLFFTRVLA